MRRYCLNEKGVTLVEAIIAAAIIGIVGTAVMAYFSSTVRATRASQVINIRDQLYASIIQDINPETLWKSAEHHTNNTNLKNCIRPDTAPCTTTDAADQQPIYLMAPDYEGGYDIIAGSSTIPTKYTPNGEVWQTGDVSMFTVEASFWATCPPRSDGTIPAACDAAETIWVRAIVKVDGTASSGSKGGRNIRSQPPQGAFDAQKHLFATPIAAKDILLIGATDCMLGSKVVGYDQFGQAICSCMSACSCPPQDINGNIISNYDPATDTPKDYSFGDCSRRGLGCSCIGSACNPVTHFMSGLKADNTPQCTSRRSEELCSQINIQTNGDCGEGSQMVAVQYGACTTNFDAKGGGWEINCDDDIATCCPMIL